MQPSVSNMTGNINDIQGSNDQAAKILMDTGKADHDLLIAIYGTLNQIVGKMEGHVKQLEAAEKRQNEFESMCTLSKRDYGLKLDVLEHKIDTWSGMVKAFALIFGSGTILSLALNVWKMVIQ